MHMNTAAGIVTFNPEIERLKANIKAIEKQVTRVILFDNGSENIIEIEQTLSKCKNALLLKNNKNIGIAAALNRIFEKAESLEIPYVLTLDQDSICPGNIISIYEKNLFPSIGILTPQLKDIHLNEYYFKSDKSIEEVDRCITSAALTSVKAWKMVNGFDEDMFIDCVDFDFCDRIRKKGYKIIRVYKVVLLHEIGNISKHKIGPFVIRVKNHSPFRKYYITRNTVYLARKHKSKREIIKSVLQGIKQILLVIFFENQKKEKIHQLEYGIRDGFKMKIDERWA